MAKQSKRKGVGLVTYSILMLTDFMGYWSTKKKKRSSRLKDWLFLEYGKNETNQMLATAFQRRGREEQYRILTHFLEWFRSQYPYYYDRCDSCGSS
jgi:hypothetical protein